jgi:hypothetical protein
MDELLKAIITKISGSALSSAVGGRIYLDQAPEEKPGLPYIVFFIVTSVPEKTFTENFEDILIQFSIFSNSQSVAEISAIYDALNTLFDECSFTMTSDTLIRMNRENLATMIEEAEGLDPPFVRHWAVDYSILIEKN